MSQLVNRNKATVGPGCVRRSMPAANPRTAASAPWPPGETRVKKLLRLDFGANKWVHLKSNETRSGLRSVTDEVLHSLGVGTAKRRFNQYIQETRVKQVDDESTVNGSM